MRSLCLLLAVGTLNTASAEVFQCTDANGNIAFTDQPCQGNGKKIEINAPESRFDRARREREKKEKMIKAYQWERIESEIDLCGNFTLEQIQDAEEVAVGMSEHEVEWIMGYPDTVNRSAYGSDQWVYDSYPHSNEYVYIEDGCVVNWQR